MSGGVLEEVIAGHLRGILRMNVGQFERFMEMNFPEGDVKCELIDGYPVLKDCAATGEGPMIMGSRHGMVVDTLNTRLGHHLYGAPCSLKCQTPVVLNTQNVLEPDLAILRGRNADFYPDYPDATSLILVIEVADSSLEADRITKLKKYASEAIPTYWIVNLRDDQIEVYQSPDREREAYHDCHICFPQESVTICVPGLQDLTLSVQDILNATL